MSTDAFVKAVALVRRDIEAEIDKNTGPPTGAGPMYRLIPETTLKRWASLLKEIEG